MKRVLRSFAVGLLVGGVLGLWFGMNIGKGQDLLSNPFADVPLAQKTGRRAQEGYEAAKEEVQKAGKAAKDELQGE